jgi:hypothetical protein
LGRNFQLAMSRGGSKSMQVRRWPVIIEKY